MILLDEAESILRAEGYRTRRERSSTGALTYFRTEASSDLQRALSIADALVFENATVVGFVRAFDAVDTLIGEWEMYQHAFLRSNSARLRLDPDKAWSVYALFLSSASASPAQRAALGQIEEDLQSTRKIARSDVISRADLQRALLPLLRVRTVAGGALIDAHAELRERLDPDQAIMLHHLERGDTERAVAWLLGSA